METKQKSLTEVHLAVFLFGLSGLFGKLITLPPLIIVFGRVFFSSGFLFAALISRKQALKLNSQKDSLSLVLMGLLLTIHWTSFFRSIQISTVAVGLITFSTFPVFVTFLEPYLLKEKIRISNIVTAFISLLGVILIIPKLEWGDNLTQGVLWGLLSGFTYAILSLFNRKYVNRYSSLIVAFYEQLTAVIILIPFLVIQKPHFVLRDILLLAILGTVFTGIAHTLFIRGLKGIKAQTASIISSLEPVYGIIFAAMILAEIPSIRVIFGGCLIIGAIFYSTIHSKNN